MLVVASRGGVLPEFQYRPANLFGAAYLLLLLVSIANLLLGFSTIELQKMTSIFTKEHRSVPLLIVYAFPYAISFYMFSSYLKIEQQTMSSISFNFKPNDSLFIYSNIARFGLICLLSLKLFSPSDSIVLCFYALAISLLFFADQFAVLQLPQAFRSGEISTNKYLLSLPYLDVICILGSTSSILFLIFPDLFRPVLFATLTFFVGFAMIGSGIRLWASRRAFAHAISALVAKPKVEQVEAVRGEEK